MLIADVRKHLEKYHEKDLRELVAHMYKAIPKRVIEEKDIDALLVDMHAQTNSTRTAKAEPALKIDFEVLKDQIEEFAEYAHKQYYFAPNRYISKKERPKWRFKVKDYLKQLQSIPVDNEHGEASTQLMAKLYEVLSYACGYHIFSSENPFASAFTQQPVLLDAIVSRKLSGGVSSESIRFALKLCIDHHVDRETLHSDLVSVLLDHLHTPDSKELAIEQCNLYRAELKSKQLATGIRSSSLYENNRKIDDLAEAGTRLMLMLGNYDQAGAYYLSNSSDRDPEIKMYILLKIIYQFELMELWIKEFEQAKRKGIEMRQQLEKMYQYIIKHQSFPEYYG